MVRAIVAPDSSEARDAEADVSVFATPDGIAQAGAEAEVKAGRKVIDYSGDFRFDSTELYSEYARRIERDPQHRATKLLEQSVYGLTELHREAIK